MRETAAKALDSGLRRNDDLGSWNVDLASEGRVKCPHALDSGLRRNDDLAVEWRSYAVMTGLRRDDRKHLCAYGGGGRDDGFAPG